jgi:predicted ArsR family transcriptional regulator
VVEQDEPRSGDVRVFRALSSPVRSRLLDVLRAEPDLDAAGLAERLDLHVNTVRTHLGVLEEAGLVAVEVEARDRPGRPRQLYRATQRGAPDEADRGYRFLAEVLASYLSATAPDPAAAAEEAGTAWGSHVVATPPPFARLGDDEAVARLVAMLDELGFAPQLASVADDPSRPRVLLHRCPFLDTAREHPDIVCSVHLGLMRGALTELGVDVRTEDLIPWAEPEVCVAHLRLPDA